MKQIQAKTSNILQYIAFMYIYVNYVSNLIISYNYFPNAPILVMMFNGVKIIYKYS